MTQVTFSSDFSTARTRFLQAANAAGAQVESHSYPARGPKNEELATDVAWIGSASAPKVLVTVSGTHGVEGFCGSGAQVSWFERGEAKRLPPDTAVMLVHAINPYGFAWCRRVTHENVDLNRNWIDFDAPLPENHAYDEIATTLCPTEWTEQSRAHTLGQLQVFMKQHGFPAFVQIVSGGQYEYEKGIFFGGTSPTASRHVLTTILTERLTRAERVGFIDYHSGLGSPGFGELIASAFSGSEVYARARRWYGMNVMPIGSQGEEFAKVGGDWLSATPGLLPGRTVTAIAIEFGTVDPLQVLDALRADNWLHTYGGPQSPAAASVKAQITKAFYTDDDVWRGMVLGQSLLACRHAIAGLSA